MAPNGMPSSSGQCHSNNGLPDSSCTPGVANPNVNQGNIQSTICVSGFTTTIRPPVSYTNGLKTQQMGETGIHPRRQRTGRRRVEPDVGVTLIRQHEDRPGDLPAVLYVLEGMTLGNATHLPDVLPITQRTPWPERLHVLRVGQLLQDYPGLQ